jgi:hypothetical protein
MKALFLIALSALAQNPPQPKLSISGTVRDIATGLPAEADVAVSQKVNTQTDAQGHYTLHDLDPGHYRITVTGNVASFFGFQWIFAILAPSGKGLPLPGAPAI